MGIHIFVLNDDSLCNIFVESFETLFLRRTRILLFYKDLDELIFFLNVKFFVKCSTKIIFFFPSLRIFIDRLFIHIFQVSDLRPFAYFKQTIYFDPKIFPFKINVLFQHHITTCLSSCHTVHTTIKPTGNFEFHYGILCQKCQLTFVFLFFINSSEYQSKFLHFVLNDISN